MLAGAGNWNVYFIYVNVILKLSKARETWKDLTVRKQKSLVSVCAIGRVQIRREDLAWQQRQVTGLA